MREKLICLKGGMIFCGILIRINLKWEVLNLTKKQEDIFTPSGHQVDKDLMRVPIKVSPSLQALIVNQIELIEMIEGKIPQNLLFIEQHRVEMLQVEGEIANAFSSYRIKKEKEKERRLLKKKAMEEGLVSSPLKEEHDQIINEDVELFPVKESTPIFKEGFDFKPDVKSESIRELSENNSYKGTINENFGIMQENTSSGLPSSKYETRTHQTVKKVEVDVRRVALGASIKALQNFLGRELNEEEISSLEAQVDSYLN